MWRARSTRIRLGALAPGFVADDQDLLAAEPDAAADPAPAQRHAFAEEIANAASHAVGVVMACAALPSLALAAVPLEPARLAGVLVFALSMLVVFLASSVFHALPVGRAKALLRRVDHAAIYLFIAGSFTPFAVAARDAAGGLAMLGVIWIVAACGVALKLSDRLRHRSVSTLLYLVFGWAVVAAAQPALATLNRDGLHLLALGGVAYNVGCVFYLLEGRLRYSHLVWHLFVLVGSASHFLAVMQTLA